MSQDLEKYCRIIVGKQLYLTVMDDCSDFTALDCILLPVDRSAAVFTYSLLHYILFVTAELSPCSVT